MLIRKVICLLAAVAVLSYYSVAYAETVPVTRLDGSVVMIEASSPEAASHGFKIEACHEYLEDGIVVLGCLFKRQDIELYLTSPLEPVS